MTSWQFQPILDRYLPVLVIGLVLIAIMWRVRPAFAGVTRQRLRVLTLLRGIVVFLLLLLALRPVLIRARIRTPEASIVFLIDRSRSMSITDDGDGKSRWDAMERCLDGVRSLVAQLPAETPIRSQFFAGDAELPVPELVSLAGQQPQGEQTDLGGALQHTLDHLSGETLRAVILLSDGAQRAVSPSADAEQVARDLARRNTALVTVPFGRGRDGSQTRDIAVESLPEFATVYVKNRLTISAGIRVAGYVGQPIPIRCTLQNAQDASQSLPPQSLTAQSDSDLIEVKFQLTPEAPGEYRLVVEAEPQAGELITQNNTLTCFVQVLEGGVRVLYVESNPLSQEYQWLQRAWFESPDIQLETRILPRNLRAKWPLPLPNLAEKKYDVVVLGDVDSQALQPDWLNQLRTQVEQGCGCLALGGFHTQGPGGYANTPLAEVLPIRMENIERQEPDPEAAIRDDIQLKGELLLVPERDHPIFRWRNAEDTLETWKTLPPLQGALRWSAVKPDGIILARSPQRDPLLVAGQYGQGHVLAFAGFSTWRWQTHGFAEHHRRFWRQTLLWLAMRDESPDSRLRLNLSRRRVALGEPISAEVGWRASVNDKTPAPTIRARLLAPATSAPLELQSQAAPAPGLQAAWSIKVPTQQAGLNRVELTAERNGQPIETVTTSFLVIHRDLELEDPAANPAFLQRLARHTELRGGTMVAPEQLPAALSKLTQTTPQQETEIVERWQLGDKSIDAWIVFLLSTSCLVGEWYLRKRWGMV